MAPRKESTLIVKECVRCRRDWQLDAGCRCEGVPYPVGYTFRGYIEAKVTDEMIERGALALQNASMGNYRADAELVLRAALGICMACKDGVRTYATRDYMGNRHVETSRCWCQEDQRA